MSYVSAIDAIKYGFGLLGYLLAVGVATVIVFAIGGVMAGAGADPTNPNAGGALLGSLIMLAGFLVLYAGLLGLGYKVLVDGVAAGIESANGGASAMTDGGQPIETRADDTAIGDR